MKRDDLTYPIRPLGVKTLEPEDVEEIKRLLKTTDLSHTEIAENFKVSHSLVSLINKGKRHYDDSISYPIRKTNYRPDSYYFYVAQELRKGRSHQSIADDLLLSKSVVTAYNVGRSKSDLWPGTFPIAADKETVMPELKLEDVLREYYGDDF